MNKKLLRKFITFFYGSILSMAIGFISVPILTRILSPNEYAKITLFITITGILSTILSLGTEQAFVRFFYEESEENRCNLLKKCLIIPLVFTSLYVIFMILWGRNIVEFYFNDKSKIIYILFLIQPIILMLINFSNLVIRMQQKGNLYSLLQILNKSIYVILVIGISKIFVREYKVAVIALVVSSISIFFVSALIEKKYWSIKLDRNIETNNDLKNIILFSFPLFITLMVNWVFQSADKFVLQRFASYEELGIYASAFTIVSLMNIIQTSFTIFWTPVALEKYHNEPKNTMFFTNVLSIVTVVMIIMATLIIIFRDIIIILLGKSYGESIYIIPMLLFIPIMYTISEITQIGINFKKKPKYHIVVGIISSSVDVILLLLLVPKLGARGAAIATGISYITFFLMRTIFSLKLYKVDYKVPKLSIVLLCFFIFSLYATFYKVTLILNFLGIGMIGIVLLTYNKEFMIFVKYTKKYIYDYFFRED